MMSKLDKALNIEDLRKIARRKLPKPLFNYIDGGADDESNVCGNAHAYDAVKLVPEYLVDVADVDERRVERLEPILIEKRFQLRQRDIVPAVRDAHAEYASVRIVVMQRLDESDCRVSVTAADFDDQVRLVLQCERMEVNPLVETQRGRVADGFVQGPYAFFIGRNRGLLMDK